ncbi:hypothetical protein PIB30_111511, partial [Stylosanthes scabra]|nr:hypothetical protein [Stylosanthes scabra]
VKVRGEGGEIELDSEDGSDEEFIGEMTRQAKARTRRSLCQRLWQVKVFSPSIAPIPELSSINSHFHTLNLDAMMKEPIYGFGGGGQDYNLGGGEEFTVGHHFSSQKTVQIGVKNYNIRRAAYHRVLKFDSYKYVCRCKQSDVGCPWTLHVSLWINLGY